MVIDQKSYSFCFSGTRVKIHLIDFVIAICEYTKTLMTSPQAVFGWADQGIFCVCKTCQIALYFKALFPLKQPKRNSSLCSQLDNHSFGSRYSEFRSIHVSGCYFGLRHCKNILFYCSCNNNGQTLETTTCQNLGRIIELNLKHGLF